MARKARLKILTSYYDVNDITSDDIYSSLVSKVNDLLYMLS